MFNRKQLRIAGIGLLAVLFCTSQPVLALADGAEASVWRESESLPGTDSNIGPILIIGGIVLAGVITWAIVSRNKTPKVPDEGQAPEENAKPEQEPTKGSEAGKTELRLINGIAPSELGPRVLPLLSLREEAIHAGVSLHF